MRARSLVWLALLLPLAARAGELPPLELQAAGADARLSSGVEVSVREFRVVGSRVIEPEALAEALRPYTGRRIGSEELLAARDALTALYRERGYLTSGAVLPDQQVENGVVELRVIEGVLDEVEVSGARSFRASFLRERVLGARGEPLEIGALERRLQQLQQDARIRRVDAHLEPGAGPGRSRLRLRVEEEQPWRLALEAANDAAPSLGGLRSEVGLGHQNLSGRGDELELRVAQVHGLSDLALGYRLPLGRWDTEFALSYERSRSEIVEDPFQDLDVRSRGVVYGAGLTQPFWRDLGGDWKAGLVLEHERSELRLEGEPFALNFAGEGDEERVTALRHFHQLVLRSENQVFAARAQASLGIDLFGATIAPSSAPGSDIPDGRFLVGLLQLQWAGRLDRWLEGSQLRLRFDAQLARDALLSLERISIGGAHSVRGYHENELVRDNGLVASAELGLPLWRDALGQDRVQLVPFFDFGKAWNREREASLESIASAGLGVRCWPTERLELELFWGAPLRDLPDRDGDALQDAGFHLRIRAAAF